MTLQNKMYDGIVTDQSHKSHIQRSIYRELCALPYYHGYALDVKIERLLRFQEMVDRSMGEKVIARMIEYDDEEKGYELL